MSNIKVGLAAFAMRHFPGAFNRLANCTEVIAAPLKKAFTGGKYNYGAIRLQAYMYNYVFSPTAEQIHKAMECSIQLGMGRFEKGRGYNSVRKIRYFPITPQTARPLFGNGINREELDRWCIQHDIRSWVVAIERNPNR